MRRAAKWALVVVVLLALVGALNQPAPKSEQPRRDIAATPSATPLPTSTPRPSRHGRTRTHHAATPTPDYGSGDEIPNYENGTGYRVQCADGMYSHSGGRPGACSGHGGVG
jgi:hypothetical protein